MIMDESNDILATLLGRCCPSVDVQSMIEVCKAVCTYVNKSIGL